MANGRPEERALASVEVPSSAERQFAADPASTPDQKVAELCELTLTLLSAAQAMKSQQASNANVQHAIDDVRALSRAMLTSSAAGAAPVPAPQPCTDCSDSKGNCDGGPCDCVSANCCCFDILLSSVRVLAMQPLELADSGANPWGELEVQRFAYLDVGSGAFGAVIPSMFSTLTLRKLLQHPGVLVRLDRPIGTVCLRKGKTKTIKVGVEAVESDAGLIERTTGGRDEEGSNTSTMLLDCCCSAPPTTKFDISFTSGGQGGGAIEVEFTAVRKC